MPPDEIIVQVPDAAPTQPSTHEVLAAAESMVQQAAQLAHMPDADSDRVHELIAICSEVRDDVRTIRVMLEGISADLASVRVSQIVAEVEAEPAPTIVEEPAAPETPVHVEVNAPSDGSMVEKETVIDDNPPVPEKRVEQKSARRWL